MLSVDRATREGSSLTSEQRKACEAMPRGRNEEVGGGLPSNASPRYTPFTHLFRIVGVRAKSKATLIKALLPSSFITR